MDIVSLAKKGEESEGEEPVARKDVTPTESKQNGEQDVQSGTSASDVKRRQKLTTVENGLRLRLNGKELPFACYTYGVVPNGTHPSFSNWTLLVLEDDSVAGSHIRCHAVKEEEDLSRILKKYKDTGSVMVVLINDADDYCVSRIHSEDHFEIPVLVITSRDGRGLFERLRKEFCGVFVQVYTTSSSKSAIRVEPIGDNVPFRTDDGRSQAPIAKVLRETLLSTSGTPICVSKNKEVFAQLMADFTSYEKMGGDESANKRNFTVLKRHRDKMLGEDFPFHLLLVYRFGLNKKIYKGKDLDLYLKESVRKVEELDPEVIAETMNLFIESGNFPIHFHGGNQSSVFNCLESTCVYLEELLSGDKVRSFPDRCVYSRMLMTSLAMKCQKAYLRSTLPKRNHWDTFIKNSSSYFPHHLPDVLGEFAQGLVVGKLLHLDFECTFLSGRTVGFMVSDTHVQSFSVIRSIFKTISDVIPLPPEAAAKFMWEFMNELKAYYKSWIQSKSVQRKEKLCALHSHGEEEDVVVEGLEFLSSVLQSWKAKDWDKSPAQEYMHEDCKGWISLLLEVIDFTSESAVGLLQQNFTRSKTEVANRYKQKDMTVLICNETRKYLTQNRLTPECFLNLYKGLFVFKEEVVQMFLLSEASFKQGMNLIQPPWQELLVHITILHSGASRHEFLVNFLGNVSECYKAGDTPQEFVLDLLRLKVPRLFEISGNVLPTLGLTDEGVRNQFSLFIKKYIYDNNLQEILISRMKIILEILPDTSCPENSHEFQHLIVTTLQEVVIPDVKKLHGWSTNDNRKALQNVLACLSANLKWKDEISPRQAFCWHVVSVCCQRVSVSQEEFRQYTTVIEELCKIYEAYCHGMPGESVLGEELPDVTKNNQDIERYFTWVKGAQEYLLHWESILTQQDVTNGDITFYKSMESQFRSIAYIIQMPSAVVETKVQEKAFAHYSDSLDTHLVKHIPKKTSLKWRKLTALLATYGVKLPPYLSHRINASVTFPELTTTQSSKIAVVPKFRVPGLGNHLVIEDHVTLKDLCALVEELNSFLKPLNPHHIDMMVFFSLHGHTLFQTNLVHRMATVKGTTPETELPFLSTNLSDGNDTSTCHDGVLQLKEALQDTEELLCRIVEGTATLSEITADGELNLNDMNMVREFEVLADYIPHLPIGHNHAEDNSSDIILRRVQNLLELLTYANKISEIERVLYLYNIQGCLQDNDFDAIKKIRDELNHEDAKHNLTPQGATEKLCKIKKALHLETQRQHQCLSLFPKVEESVSFYNFLKDKKFAGEGGQKKFTAKYELVTTQLHDSEEYDQIVLSHLRGAFEFMHLFTLKRQRLQELMCSMQQFNQSENVAKQLNTVNSNITRIRVWFTRSEGETLDNIDNQLKCIIKTGHYHFNLATSAAKTGQEIELVYLLPSTNADNGDEVSHGAEAIKWERWKRESIDEFVQKLGFLDNDQIQNFIKQNEEAYKLLDDLMTLQKLGHPSYSCPERDTTHESASPEVSHPETSYKIHKADYLWMLCYPHEIFPLPEVPINEYTAKRQLNYTEVEQELKDWRSDLEHWHTQYDWLLFLSVPKVLKLYRILRSEQGDKSVEEITTEVSFLFQNTITARKAILFAVKHLPPQKINLRMMETVGCFLKELQAKVKYVLPLPDEFHEFPLTLHSGSSYSQRDIILKIIGIYMESGLPQPFEVFHCSPETTEEDLHLFKKRVLEHCRHYVILQVNRLPFRLQEHLLLLSAEIAESLGKRSSQGSNIHFVESSSSVLQERPWIHAVKEETLSFKDAKDFCRRHIIDVKTFQKIHLVYGHPGDGKTHYIKKQLEKFSFRLIIAVNEAFSVLRAIEKLRTLPLTNNSVIFFNFTLIPPGDSVDESERKRYNSLMDKIGWFFFDLLLLGYVEDKATGTSFHVPGELGLTVFAEVPITNPHMEPKDALKQFENNLPALGLLGESHQIDTTEPLVIDSDVQLVCKYLQAYSQGGKDGIDRLYLPKDKHLQLRSPPPLVPVKFSTMEDLHPKECKRLLEIHMGEDVRKNKLMQKVFVRYMYRRCYILDNLAAFNYNQGFGEMRNGKETDTTELGSTLMKAMISEVKEFCNFTDKHLWAKRGHYQLIYDFKDGSSSIGLISLNPEKLDPEVKANFEKIGVHIPTVNEVHSREVLDEYLSRALNVPLSSDGRLTAIDDSAYVLTLDYAVKMLTIHERYECGVPVILEGETGVGKTALVEMLRTLWNDSLLSKWTSKKADIIDTIGDQLSRLPKNTATDKFIDAVDKLSCGKEADKSVLVKLAKLPDYSNTTTSCRFCVKLEQILLSLKEDVVISVLDKCQEINALFAGANHGPECVADLLNAVFTAKFQHLFYKLNVHSGLQPLDVQKFFKPIFTQAERLKELQTTTTNLKLPSITVFLDEVNTSLCVGLFKEIITDKSLDGQPLPSNIFIVAACNPHRGNSLAVHSWLSPSYYVRKLHPTMEFLKWDYGSLDGPQEGLYITEKMRMLERNQKIPEIKKLAKLIAVSQEQMRSYAYEQFKHIVSDPEKCSQCCVSQRDIQRVFTFYQKLKKIYEHYSPHGKQQDYNHRAMLVSLGIVYYMRLSTEFKIRYERFLNKGEAAMLGTEVTFTKALQDDLDWFTKDVSLKGIAKTRALQENLFAIIMCTMTHTPLIITGAPGSSKTLSFKLAVANLLGQESKSEIFRNTTHFKSLDPHIYQCSRRTTAKEIEKIFARAVKRQQSHQAVNLPIYCVVFMDEAGLPSQKHEALKVLHSWLDKHEVSFVAITNNILDAAKSNRAVSLFRPKHSLRDLEILAEGCVCPNPDGPPLHLRDHIGSIRNYCQVYYTMMDDTRFNKFFGLRDFIHFVTFLRRNLENDSLTDQLVLQSLERNFSGTEDFKEISEKFLKFEGLKRENVLDVLKGSLQDRPQVMSTDNEVRYKLIIDPSEDDSLVRLLFTFGVLKRDNTYVYTCSNFPGDGPLEEIKTIAAIRHSVAQGHTVLLCQTDDIHESFYDLFNQRFKCIEHEDGLRFFTNIAIGPIIKPSRVHENFQCVVVMKKSEVASTPSPFLNRFEKYSITHESLLDAVIKPLPRHLQRLLQTAVSKANEFIECVNGSASLYGLQQETLHSLVLAMLPPAPQVYTTNLLNIKSCGREMHTTSDIRVNLLKLVLMTLCKDLKFCIPMVTDKELEAEAKHVFELVECDPALSAQVRGLNQEIMEDVTNEAFSKLISDTELSVSELAAVVICVLQQWLIQYLCKSLIQLMTTEALVHHRRKIPSYYLRAYLNQQSHFSITELITRQCQLQDQCDSFCEAASKLICYTRSSALIRQLPATHQPVPVSKHTTVYALASLRTRSSVQEVLKEFTSDNSKRVFLIIVDMQETSKRMVNHMRMLIEEAETKFIRESQTKRGEAKSDSDSQIEEADVKYDSDSIQEDETKSQTDKRKKLFVLLLHFPPSMLFDACYPTLFLKGWNHHYLDTVGHDPKEALLDISDWFKLCFFEHTTLPSVQQGLLEALNKLIMCPEATTYVSSWSPWNFGTESSLSKPTSLVKRRKVLTGLFKQNGIGEVICKLFQSYWDPTVMVECLETAANLTVITRESTLNMVEFVTSDLKSKFFDFLVYIVAKMNEDFNINIILGQTHTEKVRLFLAILQTLPLPKLSELKSRWESLREQAEHQAWTTSFPFFRLVSEKMDEIVEQCRRTVNQSLNLLSGSHEASQTATYDRNIVCKKMYESIQQTIGDTGTDDQVKCLHTAIEAIAANKDGTLWQNYFQDFLHQKLHVAPREMSSDLFKALEVVEEGDPRNRFINLHIRVNVYELDFVKLSTLIRTLNQIAQSEVHQESRSFYLKRVKETRSMTGIGENFFSRFIIDTLFSAMLKAMENKEDFARIHEWEKAYHDLVSMPLVREHLYTVPIAIVDEAKFNIMHTLYLILHKTHGVHMQEVVEVFEQLHHEYLTEEKQLNSPQISEAATIMFSCLRNYSESETAHILGAVEGLFSHFFPPIPAKPYDPRNCSWFLELANRQIHWLVKERLGEEETFSVQESSEINVTPEECVSLYVFKKYLGRVLGTREERKDKETWDSGPLGIYRPERRKMIGIVLTSNTSLGSPGTYIPFYYECAFPVLKNNAMMHQPLAHLYFMAVMEHLVSREFSRTDLLVLLSRISEHLAGSTVSIVDQILLYIEKEAVLQVFIKMFVQEIDPECSKDLHKLFSDISAEDLNKVLDNETTGGKHGLMLALHLLKHYQSFEKFQKLFSEKSELKGIKCLQPLHLSLKDVKMGDLFCLHQHFLENDLELYGQIQSEALNSKVDRFLDFAKQQCGGEVPVTGMKYHFIMILWMCTYFVFFKKKQPLPLAKVLEENAYKGLDAEYMRPIVFFLSTEPMSTAPILGSSPQIADTLVPIYHLFCPPHHDALSVEASQLRRDGLICDAMAVTMATTLGCPPRSTHLWYLMFAPDELMNTSAEKLTQYLNLTQSQLPFTKDGICEYSGYWDSALHGNLSIHSHCLMLWTSISSLCMSLLTQPGAFVKVRKLIHRDQSLASYCVHQVRQVWEGLQSILSVSEEQQFFLIIMCMKKLYEEVSQDRMSAFHPESLHNYEEKWHTSVFLPAWKSLKQTFFGYTSLDSVKLFKDLRKLDVHYPQFPQRSTLAQNLLALPGALSPEQGISLLSLFVLKQERLEVGEDLLPMLIEFHRLLYSELAYQLTREQAQVLTVEEVVAAVTKRCPNKAKAHLQALYQNLKEGYNRYIKSCSGIIDLAREGLLPSIGDDTRIIQLLSTDDPGAQSSPSLYSIICHLIHLHNQLLGKTHGLECYHPNAKIPTVHPTEAQNYTAIVSKGKRLHNTSHFVQILRSRYQSDLSDCECWGNWIVSYGVLIDNTNPAFDYKKLQEDVIKEYLVGKPILKGLTRQIFCFRDSVSSLYHVQSSGSSEDLSAKISAEFKVELPLPLETQLEMEFHYSTFQVLHEVVIALKTLVGYLTNFKALESSACVSQTLLVFLQTLFTETDCWEQIGIYRDHYRESQLKCLGDIELQYIHSTLELFVTWIKDGMYNFNHVPYTLKTDLREEVVQAIPSHYQDEKQLLDELKGFCELLTQNEITLMQKIMTTCTPESHIVECIEIPHEYKRISKVLYEARVKHYVSLQVQLRKLKSTLSKSETPQASALWTDYVLDQLTPELVAGRQPAKANISTGFPAGDHIGSLQKDLAQLAADFYKRDDRSHQGEITCTPAQGSMDGDNGAVLTEDELKKQAELYKQDDIVNFLYENKLDDYVDIFEEQEVTGEDLLGMTDDDLKNDLGMSCSIDRFKLKIQFERKLLGAQPKYSVEDVVRFLQSTKKLHVYAQSFRDNEIDGEILLNANPEMLEELGVKSRLDQTVVMVLFRRRVQNELPHKTVEDVGTFLRSNKRFSEYATKFEENEIDGDIMKILVDSPELLEELGIQNGLHRKQISRIYKELDKENP